MAEKNDVDKNINAILHKVRKAIKERRCGNIRINLFQGGITSINQDFTEKPPFFDEAA